MTAFHHFVLGMIHRLVGLTILSTFPALLLGQETPAQVWRAMGSTHQRVYLMGIVDGAIIAQAQSGVFLGDSTARRWLKQSPDKDEPIDSALATSLRRFTSANANAVTEMVTRIYDDPANGCLSWPVAVIVSIERLNGASKERLDQALNAARKLTATECSVR
jgi:hypothetical protein